MIRYFPLIAPYDNCSPYGPRGDGFHYGVDLCAPTGTTIVAADDGVVSYGADPMGGNVAILHMNDGTGAVYYAHMLDEREGRVSVAAGQVIGRVDMSGNAQGTVPHLHLELWPSGGFQRPAPDPTPDLLAATRLAAPVDPLPRVILTTGQALALAGLVLVSAAAAASLIAPRRRVRRSFSV